MPLKNPTRAEKIAYKEKMQRGQGMDLEPKSNYENASSTSKDPLAKENNEERRLDGSQNQQYYGDDRKGLGSPSNHDDYGDESFP